MTTLREAAEMALEALKQSRPRPCDEDDDYAELAWKKHTASMDALRSALEQQAKQDETRDSLERYTQEMRTVLSGAAKREWQGLTDEEISAAVREASKDSAIRRDGSTSHRIARAIEAKLKEKNT